MKLICLLLTLTAAAAAAVAQEPEAAPRPAVHVLTAAADTPEAPYLAFPALLDLGEELLISFKQGRSHAADPGAALAVLRIDRDSGRVTARQTAASIDGKIMQMGEWARFANGEIANYIDAQQKDVPTRIGLQVVRSRDNGRTFGPVQRVGKIDGVEYGYAFDAITRGQTTWMLVMTFANLAGGTQVWKTRSLPGSVDVIRTDDYGATWHFVRSLTGELGGAPINESCFAPHEDGFLIAARGYDQRQWLVRTDREFKMLQKVDLAAAHPFIKSHLGRPRLFTCDGSWYLIARNFTGRGANRMRLSLLRFDPNALAITRHVVLDNAEDAEVTDGYYAVPYFHAQGGRTRFSVVTYKRIGTGKPDIVRLEYDWEAIK